MAKLRVNLFDHKEKIRITGEMLDVISELKGREEIFDFLFRLLTQSEVLMIARRVQIAIMLIDGAKYEDIRKSMKASHRTISDIEKWLHENNERSAMIRKKIAMIKAAGPKDEKLGKASESMLDKYPHHRLIKEFFE